MAIKRNFTENIEIAPRELESELWNMDATEQADFLLALSQRYKNEHFNVSMQYEYVKDEVHSELTKEERTNVVNMLKTLVEYLEEANTLEIEAPEMEKLQKIEQIIKDHDNDRMPEDYFYIDKIREVLNDGKN